MTFFTPKIVPIVKPAVPNNPSLSVILFIRSKTVFKTLTPELSVSESSTFCTVSVQVFESLLRLPSKLLAVLFH